MVDVSGAGSPADERLVVCVWRLAALLEIDDGVVLDTFGIGSLVSWLAGTEAGSLFASCHNIVKEVQLLLALATSFL